MRENPMEAQLEIISACKTRSFSYKIDTDVWPVWHFHPEIDILLVLKNTGNYIVGDYMGTFEPGTLIMIGPNIPHSFMSNEEDEGDPSKPALIALQFSVDSLGHEFMEKTEALKINNLFNDIQYGMEFHGQLRDEANELIKQMADENELLRFSTMLRVFDKLVNCEERTRLASPSYAPSLNHSSVNKINTILNHIKENMDKTISLDDASKLVHMGSKSFSRFFKKNTGKTFVQYVNEIRIGEACKLLLNTDLSISDISFEVGYNTLSNFNRRFLDIKGVTPREFRKEINQKLDNAF